MAVYLNYNGNFVSAKDSIFSASNRGFLFGDGCFETIKVAYEKIINIENHYNRLVKSASILKIDLQSNMTISFFERRIMQLLQKNGHLPAARVRFTLFRNDGGLYKPVSNNAQYLIESTLLQNDSFELNREGLKVDIYDQNKKLPGPLSELKSCNALIYVMAGVFASENGLADALILNNNDNVVEATSSNIFIVKKNDIYSPPLSEGCVDGTMRRLIFDIAGKEKINIFQTPLSREDLNNADEMFLTNAIFGIRWVGQFRQKLFCNNTATFLAEKLNTIT